MASGGGGLWSLLTGRKPTYLADHAAAMAEASRAADIATADMFAARNARAAGTAGPIVDAPVSPAVASSDAGVGAAEVAAPPRRLRGAERRAAAHRELVGHLNGQARERDARRAQRPDLNPEQLQAIDAATRQELTAAGGIRVRARGDGFTETTIGGLAYHVLKALGLD